MYCNIYFYEGTSINILKDSDPRIQFSFVIISQDIADTGEVDQAVGHGDVGLDPGQGVPQ